MKVRKRLLSVAGLCLFLCVVAVFYNLDDHFQQTKVFLVDHSKPPAPVRIARITRPVLSGKDTHIEAIDILKWSKRSPSNKILRRLPIKLWPNIMNSQSVQSRKFNLNTPTIGQLDLNLHSKQQELDHFNYIGLYNSSYFSARDFPRQVTNRVFPCDKNHTDCSRFHQLLQEWPSNKPKAVFYYLTQPSRLRQLQNSLQSLDTYFNNDYHYPVIIFHESNFIKYIDQVRRHSKSDLYFQQVTFQIPSFLNEPILRNIPCFSAIGYRHMCRFHAKQVYQEPILRDVDYYWRLDDDSLLIRPIHYDVFQFMQLHDISYGYNWLHWDSPICTEGLWEATEKYIQKHNIKPYYFWQWPKTRIFYNNFEISKFSIWRSPEYERFIEYIDHLGGIYYKRWGDAPIHGIALALFVPQNKTHHFEDIGYRHGSYTNEGRNFTGKM